MPFCFTKTSGRVGGKSAHSSRYLFEIATIIPHYAIFTYTPLIKRKYYDKGFAIKFNYFQVVILFGETEWK